MRENAGKVNFLYKIKEGGINKSYGIFVAKLAGLPEPVLKRAIKILGNLEIANFLPTKNFDLNQQNLFTNVEKEEELTQAESDYDRKLIYDLLEDLKNLSIDDLKPIEAINILNDLKKKYYL